MLPTFSFLHRFVTALGAVAVACAATASAASAPAARPNIVFILTDDQASWTLGCYGNAQAHTPNLDRLVRDHYEG